MRDVINVFKFAGGFYIGVLQCECAIIIKIVIIIIIIITITTTKIIMEVELDDTKDTRSLFLKMPFLTLT